MAIKVRGSNPVWSMVDLDGLQLDDAYFLFVLENTLPYIPATVYHDPNGDIPWSNPIQFLGNGTLPVDIFYDPDAIYRLEVRKGSTSSDPLIYLIENYMSGASGTGPLDIITLPTDNQITNPQFSLISFDPPYELINVTDPDPIEVAPGWFLELSGTGNVTLDRIPLNNAFENSTNSPYSIRITLTGSWNGRPALRQRFNENGMLWSDKNVSCSVTARAETSSVAIEAVIEDSNGSSLGIVLPLTSVSDAFEEYTGVALLPPPSNPDIPPAAYLDFKLLLPTICDVFVSSFQLVASDAPVRYEYAEDTIERQQDHTFHHYLQSLLRQPKQNILTGFNFSLNPWQFRDTTNSNVTDFGYTADQVIVIQQEFVENAVGNNVQVGQGTPQEKHGFKVTGVTTENQFALVEYIDSKTMRPYWGSKLSLLVKLQAVKITAASNMRVKARLVYRTDLPPVLAQGEPIVSWALGADPVFSAGWGSISPKNDVLYNLDDGENTLFFEAMELPEATTADMTLGVVLYTIDNIAPAADSITFTGASLVENEFAVEAQGMTFHEVLERCQYYYETSFDLGDVVPSITTNGVYKAVATVYRSASGASFSLSVTEFMVDWKVHKRIAPQLSFYSGTSVTLNRIRVTIKGSTSSTAEFVIGGGTFWNALDISSKRAVAGASAVQNILSIPIGASGAATGFIQFHYIADARLGV